MPIANDHRNVAVLSLAQALFVTGQVVLITLSGLVGQMLADDKALVTLPVSTVVLAAALTTIPAAMLMKRVGRRSGFMLGAAIALAGMIVSSYAIWIESFWLFVAGTFVIGINGGFAQYYRFAAADAARPEFRARAISLVIAGGIVAAIAGPQLVRSTNDLFAPVPLLGSYLALIGVAVAAIATLSMLSVPAPSEEDAHVPSRPMAKIARNPVFLVAAMSGMVGYAVMSLIMTATPVAMIGCGFAVGDAAQVIQWHVLAMFVPALFTGDVIKRLGVLPVIFTGLMLLFGCVAVAVSGIDILHFSVALFALGLGWNFTFVGASTLLTEVYAPAERAKVQAANDFLVFGSVAFASLSSGALLNSFDWNTVNLFALPFIAAAALAVPWLAVRRRRQASTEGA